MAVVVPFKKRKQPADVHSVTNQKGGVGKTTIDFHWALYLVEEGYRVLGIDLDAQGNFSSRFSRDGRVGGLRSAYLFQEELPDLQPLKTELGIDLIYALNKDDALSSVEQMGLSVVPNFAKHIQKLAEDYDYIIIDTPPTNGVRMIAASVISDHIFVPVELAAFAVDGVISLIETFDMVGPQMGTRISPTGIICNKFNTRLEDHRESLEDLRKVVGPKILQSSLSIKGAIDKALKQCRPVWTLRRAGADREAGKEMRKLMEEMAHLAGVEVKPAVTTPVAKTPTKALATKSKARAKKVGIN
ncbi:ParA family protein [Pseudomonas nitroreducens]|uniref:ParA family protein n=1 Tax=Pseudomonas nitroreducens TaxID=46680 RepID=A0A6G6J7C6_PSENT|nr:ParA family protein [Pseudomonas nitroreducens]QIE91285.1 ParA family protein [Pseudomonas nitroreducens]